MQKLKVMISFHATKCKVTQIEIDGTKRGWFDSFYGYLSIARRTANTNCEYFLNQIEVTSMIKNIEAMIVLSLFSLVILLSIVLLLLCSFSVVLLLLCCFVALLLCCFVIVLLLLLFCYWCFWFFLVNFVGW
jgi:hypothetical protein